MRLHHSKSIWHYLVTVLLLSSTEHRFVRCDTQAISQQYFTIDDSDSGIIYKPSSSWLAQSAQCTDCLKPTAGSGTGGIFNNTYMVGIHVTQDEDDQPSGVPSAASGAKTNFATPASTLGGSQSLTANQPLPSDPGGGTEATGTGTGSPTTPTSPPSKASSTGDDDTTVPTSSATADKGEGGGQKGKGKGGGGGGGGGRRRGLLHPTPRFDVDDPGFTDTPVTAQFSFNGTAVWLYAIQPNMPTTDVFIPTNMNLSFILDNVPYTPYVHTIPSSSTSDPSQTGFTSNQTVFFAEGLEMTEHELVVNVGEESTFIFDYLVYRQDLPADIPANQSGSSGDAAVSDAASSSTGSKHNTATFGIAIGATVGILSIVSFLTFLSIYRRRRRSLQRERLDREGGGNNGSRSEMTGPRPFIPRYFPGTVPPPYSPLLGNSEGSGTGPSGLSYGEYSEDGDAESLQSLQDDEVSMNGLTVTRSPAAAATTAPPSAPVVLGQAGEPIDPVPVYTASSEGADTTLASSARSGSGSESGHSESHSTSSMAMTGTGTGLSYADLPPPILPPPLPLSLEEAAMLPPPPPAPAPNEPPPSFGEAILASPLLQLPLPPSQTLQITPADMDTGGIASIQTQTQTPTPTTQGPILRPPPAASTSHSLIHVQSQPATNGSGAVPLGVEEPSSLDLGPGERDQDQDHTPSSSSARDSTPTAGVGGPGRGGEGS